MSNPIFNKLRETTIVMLLCITVIAAVFYPAVFQGKLIFLEDGSGSDSLDHNIIRRYLAVQSLRKYQEFPLWEPKIGCGAPLFAESEAGVLYPAILFYFIDDLTLATNLTVLSAILIAMMGSYLWSRSLGMEPPASGAASLAYGFSYSFLLRTGQLNIIHVIAWLPTCMAVIYLSFKKAQKRYFFILTIIWAAQLLASHFQMAAVCQICCWFYIFLLFCSQTACGFHSRFKWLGTIVCALILAVLLAAVQLLPTREMAQQSTRSKTVSLPALNKLSTRWHMLAVFTNPFYLEYSDNPNETAPHNKMCFYAREWFHYIGIIPFLLCFNTFAASRQRLALSIWLQAVFFLIASLGPAYGIYYVFWRFLPFFNSFRSPGRFAIPMTCLMAVLAAIGMQNLADCLKSRCGKRLSKTAVGIILFLICCDFIYINSQVQGYLPDNWQTRPNTLDLVKAPQRIYSPYSRTAWKNHLEYTYKVPDKRCDAYWQHRALLGANLASIWAVESPEDYLSHAGGIVLNHSYIQQISLFHIMNEIYSLNEKETAAVAPKICAWFRLLGISHIITPLQLPEKWPAAEFKDVKADPIAEIPGANVYIYTLKNPLKKIRLVPALQTGIPADALDLGKLLHCNDTDGLYENDLANPTSIGHAELLTATNNKLTIETSCDQDAYLIISATYDRNWRASVEGIPAEIQRTNLCMQSVFIPRGRHLIQLQYTSPAFELGYKISIITLLAFVSLALAVKIKFTKKEK